MQLTEIPGNHDIKETLINRVNNNYTATKILFIDRGNYGSLAMSIAYSKFLSCTNKLSHDSCNSCNSCIQYNLLSHPDLHFSFPFFINKTKNISLCKDIFHKWQNLVISNPFINIPNWVNTLQSYSNSLIIPAQECIDKINDLTLKPYNSEYKTLIIWQAAYLGKNANILLKLIEESDNKTLIIAISDNISKLLPTFVSRFEIIELKPIASKELTNFAQKKYSNLPTIDIDNAVNGAKGSILNLIDNIKNQTDHYSTVIKWLRLCYQGYIPELIKFTNDVSYDNKELAKNILITVLGIIEQGIVYKYINSNSEIENEKSYFIKNFIKLFNIEKINSIYSLINAAIYDLEANINMKILFLDVSLHLNKILKND